MANPWDNDPIVRAAPSKSGGGMPWDNDPIVKAAEPKAGVVEDVAKSAASGAARGGFLICRRWQPDSSTTSAPHNS